MNKIIVIVAALMLTGCAGIVGLIPSFWDDNQSARIVTVRQDVIALDCTQAQRAQVARIHRDLEWFRLYSESKGGRQADVLALTEPMMATTQDWLKRVSQEGYRENPIYCGLKKQVLTEQAARAAKAVLGRY